MASPTVDRRHGLVGNAALKAPVLVVAISNIALSGEQTIDGEPALALNASGVPDRVLCAGQTDATENVIWDVSTGAWTRADDANGPYDFKKGTTVFVTDGTVNHGSYWQITSDGPITVGTTAVTWTTVLTGVTASVTAAAASAATASAAAAAATTAETNAETAETNAETAQAATETARDAALAASRIYADTAAGLAAVASGEYFYVPSAEVTESLILYKDNAGVAVEVKRYLSSELFKATVDLVTGELAWIVADASGNIGMALTDAGTLLVTAVDAETLQGDFIGDGSGDRITGNSDTEAALSSVTKDSAGNIVMAVGDDGAVRLSKIIVDHIEVNNPVQGNTGAPSDLQQFAAPYDGSYGMYEVNGVNSYGQSNSIGANAPAISTIQEHNDLMFNGGMVSASFGAPQRASLVAAVEGTGTNQETGAVAAMGAVHYLIEKENAMPYTALSYCMHGAAAGVGNRSIAQLAKGGLHYPVLMDDVQAAKTLCDAANKTFAMRALFFTQGENGQTDAGWSTAMSQLISDFNVDAKVITGQTEDIPAISYQVATEFTLPRQPLVAWQQEELARSDSRFIVACPTYFMPYTDTLHFNSYGDAWRGLYYGVAYKRKVIDGNAFLPVAPKATKRVGNTVMVQFTVPARPLVLDTQQVAAATNYGFELFQSDGITPIAISSVALAGPDTVKIVAAVAVPAGAILRYASQSVAATAAIRTSGPRGNLRDSQGNYLRIETNGRAFVMHNWCLIFKRTL